MKGAALRLMLAAVLFAGWLGYLAYLAVTAAHPIVLSRAQFQVSGLDVIAQIDATDSRPTSIVRVIEVPWPAAEKKLKGQTLAVQNLDLCEGWQGPGEYILPLSVVGENYEVTATPRSPGYPPARVPGERSVLPRIYPLTSQTARQFDEIIRRKTAA
jgi:hypothetical protein